MSQLDQLNKFKLKDKVIKVISKDGKFRASFLKNTFTAKTGANKHELSGKASVFFAKQLSAASLVSSFLKGEERIILEANGNGMISSLYAEAIQAGEVRGYAIFNPEFRDNTKNDSKVLGIGIYRVSKILYNKLEPISGIIDLFSGNITDELSEYLNHSEQTPSATILDAKIDDLGTIKASGGAIIQALPGTTQEEIKETFDKFNLNCKDFSNLISEYPILDDLVENVCPFEFVHLKTIPVEFYCRCSKEKFLGKMLVFDLAELMDIQSSGNNELICKYCNEHYYLDNSDFEKIIEEKKAIIN